MERFVIHPVTHWEIASTASAPHKLVGEAPLSITVQGHPFSSGLRTPGDEVAQAAGFCLAEGIADTPDDIVSAEIADPPENNRVSVTLTPARWEKIAHRFGQKYPQGAPDFGRSAEDLVDNLRRSLPPMNDRIRISAAKGFACLDTLSRHQPLRHDTRATHATAIYSAAFGLLTVAEDVGRHNGLDKAIGRLFLERRLGDAGMLVLSSRISFELVQKAIRAGIPIIFSVSRPTALAVRLATAFNMTLACLAKGGGGYIFCGEHRLDTA
ncbi:formate dehydrogenase family accessory protein F dhD [Desulfonema ishimotonii]|uniref:Formate dehydrogenase family accessory protein F dhD n=1 Tax=Desulfonema ishimotonii TaxID=45657 RepID=A0A401FWG7_9BACT|nr:formate dehydrogenase accessory sulfurtransferase FdhD [Desulfonema ishimotonii]GBC61301.1 formate dehydrogenase family accessory protein F dhD [Desulfonema ishimotonii]